MNFAARISGHRHFAANGIILAARDAEFKIDSRNGKARILEINPRFSGAVHSPIAWGLNLPGLYGHAAVGERLEVARLPALGLHNLEARRWLVALGAELREPGERCWARLRCSWRDAPGAKP